MSRRAVGIAGLAVHAAVGICPFSTSFLVAPAWIASVLVLWWAVLAVVAVQTYRRTPLMVPVLPAVALLFWLGVWSVAL